VTELEAKKLNFPWAPDADIDAPARMTTPWRPLLVFLGIAVGTTTAMAVLCAAMGWTVESRAWAALAPVAMWAPALATFVARRTVDKNFTATLPLREWGRTGAQVILRPLAFPLVVYGASYAAAVSTGLAHWSPGGGRWTTTQQIVTNVVVNLTILGIVGTFTAMGEEIGWRGYLQPRLDAAGVRASVVLVSLCQLAYHAPLMALTGYADAGGIGVSVALFAAGDLPFAFVAARASYLARSVWPAIFFHSFHNTISQWLFPRFFSVAEDQSWLRGESGILPTVGYLVLGALLYVSMRRRGQSWQALAQQARDGRSASL
jgi:membrane protease YdiL (CAAX protease family)